MQEQPINRNTLTVWDKGLNTFWCYISFIIIMTQLFRQERASLLTDWLPCPLAAWQMDAAFSFLHLLLSFVHGTSYLISCDTKSYKICSFWKTYSPLLRNIRAPLMHVTQLQTHIQLFHFRGNWYRMMYILVSGYKSCCQSQLLLSVYVLWKWNGYLSRSSLLTLIVHTVTAVKSSLSITAGHFLNTLTVIKGLLQHSPRPVCVNMARQVVGILVEGMCLNLSWRYVCFWSHVISLTVRWFHWHEQRKYHK